MAEDTRLFGGGEVRFDGADFRMAIPPAELCREVRAAVVLAAADDAKAMKDLEESVRRFTAVMRDTGVTPESVLISLKTVINNQVLPPMSPTLAEESGYNLRERITKWSIEEYFSKSA